MMSPKIFASVIAFAAMTSSSMASDLPSRKDAPFAPTTATPAYNWAGWYAGINAGYGFNSNTTSISGIDAGGILRNALVQVGTERQRGALGGFQLGVNYQTANFVYGFETDFDAAQITGSSAGPQVLVGGGPPFNVTTTQTKLDWFGTLRGRLGIAAFDRSLIYATGGLAYGHAASSQNETIFLNGACTLGANLCLNGSSQSWRVGGTIGAGWEYAFSNQWSAKLEYLYYDLGTVKNTLTPLNGAAGITFGSASKINGSLVRVGLNYHFDTPAGAVVAKY